MTGRTKIGFIGLGIMGKPMASHLIRGGHALFLHSRSGVPSELLTQGGQACSSPAEVAQNADLIITMLPDTGDVERVLFGDKGVAEGLSTARSKGGIVMDMSTISPAETRKFAAEINELGCEYVDAPVSGGDIGARNATLTIMVGATSSAFVQVKPVLELMGKTITLIGPNGTGQVCKLANQIIAALTIEAVSEGLLFASKAGADVRKVRQALMGGFAYSRVLEVHGERMIERAFEPGFRVELHQKDLGLALSNARTLGVSLPGTATVQELLNACIAHGGAAWDSSAMVRMLEKLANHEIEPPEGSDDKSWVE
ncbi:2-hydroxy-3-oxopropionate reductase [Nitrosospira multiformis]|uniref:2-hydroxy-3-oxopropionate reductase n=1 Tax=Nitrosospira multiformis TaxID=1231 RepID=A0A1H8P162_9PROT|nr:2-hydroxy-3-oxopropionate reductase [Nitrosospira multiformis]SEO35585.1 2-hydroxy-3-oxopropionate reductase [Nitrosospira multiformis]